MTKILSIIVLAVALVSMSACASKQAATKPAASTGYAK